ncbi:hypothetical protein Zmor_004449 [Zophobas morio]|uniref:Uncharacterized protein n=1 Tax=Zophobas morio TaxID=2755281 RepID=A0AA38HHT8_9CUCU|nr:hypothetical protein Zmor_004449 [Zophobas morio]
MFNALKNDTEYSLTFNITPYSSEIDDLGTMLNAKYEQKNGDENDIKIYGLNENQSTINLNTKYSDLLKTSDDSEIIPIVINKTTAKKAGLQIGSIEEMSYEMDEIQKNINNETKTACLAGDDCIDESIMTNIGIDNDVDAYVPESGQSYYSKSGSYAILSGTNPETVESALVAGNKIAGENAYHSTEPLDGLKSANNGETFVASQSKNIKFKVVGIQNSYGKAQA